MSPRGADSYARDVAAGLTGTFEAAAAEEITLEIDGLRLIVFSDHHKGARDGADDFRRCEPAYRAALGHYLEAGHRLFVLGDAEELWECSPKEVLAAYPEVLELEARFAAAGRYERFWGNHDDDWAGERRVKPLLKLLPGLRVREGLRVRLVRGGRPAGLLFFVHGHQGTAESDRFAWASRFVVRNVWRRLQRKFGFSATTPARSFELRARHDRAMFDWARSHSARPVLIAGHTHRPVFWRSRPDLPDHPSADELSRRLEELRAGGADASALADVAAQLEHVRGWDRVRALEGRPVPVDPPCYFNTGCCSFPDGDVTGLEIADGRIRLVRWPDDAGAPKPKVLAEGMLDEVLEAVSVAG
jgi:UDP-2,3-diacylglucosamine pyrophosphatase LpxH